MSEDFYIRFSGASRYEDNGSIHYRMVEPRERVDALMPLIRMLVEAKTKPVNIQRCPICNNDLKISFARFTSNPDLSIETFCETCNIHVIFDSNKIPAWAPEPKSWKEFFEESRRKDTKFE